MKIQGEEFLNYLKLIKNISEKGCYFYMDGKLKCLKDLIKETKVDLIESFTLPEQGGDFPIEEAINIWEDKVIAMNFPVSISLKGRDEAKKFMLKLFKRIFPAKNFMVQISEDLPHMFWKDIILILGEIIPKLRTFSVQDSK